MIYYTQNNKDYFLPAFEEATQIDPAYAPAYYQLFIIGISGMSIKQQFISINMLQTLIRVRKWNT